MLTVGSEIIPLGHNKHLWDVYDENMLACSLSVTFTYPFGYMSCQIENMSIVLGLFWFSFPKCV